MSLRRKLRWRATSRSELEAQETGYRFVLSFDVVQPRSLLTKLQAENRSDPRLVSAQGTRGACVPPLPVQTQHNVVVAVKD